MRRALRTLAALLLLATAAAAAEPGPDAVGFRQIDIADPADPSRILPLALFYPATVEADAAPFRMPFYTGLDFHQDAAPVPGAHPLVLFSHGRGSNPLSYAWALQLLASHGYVVAAPWHYRANSFDSNIGWLANNLWQRPKDLSLAIDALVADPTFGPLIDPARIGVAGHSQGGFTALWIGGAAVDRDLYARFQRNWKANPTVPASLRAGLSTDPTPALAVHDPRIRAVFAMAPGIVQAFGMTAETLAQVDVPVHITVGARDTQTPPADNAEFAAAHIPGAELVVLPGDVDHEIFVNECDDEGRDEFPEACIDAPGVDRAAMHARVGDDLLAFFGAHLVGR
jgi:predicted dienelactone hydrolase